MKQLTCMIFLGLIVLKCGAQTDSLKNSVETDTAKPKSTLTTGVTYCNNADYYGQVALDRLPYIAVAATYLLKSRFYFSGMAYKLLNDTQGFISATNIGAGYNFKLFKNLSAGLSYSHTFYPSNSPFLQASNPDNASVEFTYENWLSITASGDYAFGQTSDIFAKLGLSKMISLGNIGKKDIITLTPAFEVVSGTQRFYQTYITQKRLVDSLLGILLPPLTGSQTPGSTAFTKTITTMNLISYNLKVPLAYNRANYLIEVQYQLSALSNEAETGAGKVNSFLSFSFYYQF
jgi:hypothetical protein